MRAEPYTARECPECLLWIYCDDGPIAEGDRTKTLADLRHFEQEHGALLSTRASASGASVTSYPYMRWNERVVEAVR